MPNFMRVFASASNGICREFRFEKLGMARPELANLTETSMVSLKTLPTNALLKSRQTEIIQAFTHSEPRGKAQLELLGYFVHRKLRSRMSTEVPSVLPSRFLPLFGDFEGPVSRLLKNPVYADLLNHLDKSEIPDDAEIQRLAVAHADDAKHKLFRMSYNAHLSLAYTAHRFNGIFSANYRVLSEIQKRTQFDPRSVLDYGSGPGTALLAAHAIFTQIERSLAIEPSKYMAEIGQFLGADVPNLQYMRQLHLDSTEKFDLILLSHVQVEVRPQEARDALIRRLWSHLNPEGLLILLEAGTPTGFRFMHSARELFIHELGPKKFHFVGPCPHEGRCPMALGGKTWCHFEQRYHPLPPKVYDQGIRKRIWAHEKFSYLAIRKGLGPRQRYQTERQAPTAELKSFFWPRIVFPVIKARKHVLLDVCALPSNFERLIIQKFMPLGMGYKFGRKAMWGDLFRFPRRIIRPEARRLSDRVRVALERQTSRSQLSE